MCAFILRWIMDLKYMDMAIEEAKKAFEEDEVPVGCVIVKNNQILALTHNRKEQMNSATKHAEILAIEEASSKHNNWRLDGCDVYITLEPCPMCASALKQARVSHIFCGLSNSDFRNYEIVLKILESDKNNASVPIINDNKVEGVIVATNTLDILNDIIYQPYVSDYMVTFIIDEKGTIESIISKVKTKEHTEQIKTASNL